MDLYKTEFIDSYIDLNKFIGFRGILLYTVVKELHEAHPEALVDLVMKGII